MIETIVDRSDYFIGGPRGARIQWWRADQFKTFDGTGLLNVVGWETPIPRVGQFLCGEFERSWMRFEFIEIERCGDPPDMFFAKVKFTEQVMK